MSDFLSAYAYIELRKLSFSPVPVQSLNPYVTRQFLKEKLVEIVMRQSPFGFDRGRYIEHYGISQEGRERLAGQWRHHSRPQYQRSQMPCQTTTFQTMWQDIIGATSRLWERFVA